MFKKNKTLSLLSVFILYCLGFIATKVLLPFNPSSIDFFIVLGACIFSTVVIFLFSYLFRNSSLYDPYWSVTPPVISLYLFYRHPEGDPIRQFLLLTLVLFWSVRLTINWIRSWKGLNHEDWRYQKIARQTGRYYWLASFSGIHMMPTLLVYLGCLPLFYVFPSSIPFSYFEILPVLITIAAVLIEWIADEQLRYFRKNSPRDSFMKSGLWAIVRHPNYSGEILFWTGLFLFIPFRNLTEGFWTILGPLAMVLLFKYISVPMMDGRNLERRAGYQEHMEKVPALFPFPRKKK